MTNPRRILYWFRNDLRIHDNEGFCRAVQQADEVLPVYVFDPQLFAPLTNSSGVDIGFRKTGIFRANFLIECVADLRRSLRNRGAHLVVRVGDPAKIMAELAQEIGAEAVYASKEVTQEEVDAESTLSKLLKPSNIDLELFWQSTLYHVRDLPFEIARLPDTFTQFRHQIERRAKVRAVIDDPERVKVVPDIDPGDMPGLATFGFSEAMTMDVRRAVPFKGGETIALERLQRYIWDRELIKSYKDTRNGMLGEDYSSKFSAWLAHGCLSPRLIHQEVMRYETERVRNSSTYWLVFELIWRDFFRFVALRFGDRIFNVSGIRHDTHKIWRRDPDVFSRWTEGETGIPFVDANMRELAMTGFMSNRGRQNVASFLAKDLGIDWTWGAAWFESLLVDYDPCSNWGNWNYVAGVGNDPREDRYFNIYGQAIRYDEQGQYVKYWLPELADVPSSRVHIVSNLTSDEQEQYGIRLGDSYPKPLINPNKWLRRSS